jgi:cytochrome c biogenesis protein CcdA
MTTPGGFRDRRDDGLLTLIGELPELVRNLVVAEVNAAKAWAARTGKDAGIVALWFVLALFFLFWLIPALGAFAIIGLSSWMPAWLASLILVVLGIVLIAVCALLGLRRVRRMQKTETPVVAVRKDTRMVKDVIDER